MDLVDTVELTRQGAVAADVEDVVPIEVVLHETVGRPVGNPDEIVLRHDMREHR